MKDESSRLAHPIMGGGADSAVLDHAPTAMRWGTLWFYSSFCLHPSSLAFAIVAQLAEHRFCKPAVTGSTPVDGFGGRIGGPRMAPLIRPRQTRISAPPGIFQTNRWRA